MLLLVNFCLKNNMDIIFSITCGTLREKSEGWLSGDCEEKEK